VPNTLTEPAYRPTRVNRLLAIMAVATVLAFIFAMIIGATLARQISSGVFMTIIMVPFFGGMIAMFASITIADRKRRRTIAERLSAEGYFAQCPPDQAQREQFLAPFAHLTQLKTGGKGLRWIAGKREGDKGIALFEHFHSESTGYSQVNYVFTVAAVPCDASWPTMQLSRKTKFSKLIAALTPRPTIELGDADFDDRWQVSTEDEAFTRELIARIRPLLVTAPKAEHWFIGHGQVCGVCSAALDIEAVLVMAERVRMVAGGRMKLEG
jgi:hypothetical protein